MTQTTPLSLKAVIWLFIILGTLGILVTIYNLFHGLFQLNPMVVHICIAIGLVRRNIGWHSVAILWACAWSLIALLIMIMVVPCYEALRKVSEDHGWSDWLIPSIFASILASGIVNLAIIRLLTLRSIKLRFGDLSTDRTASTLAAMSLVALVLSLSRLSGGIEGGFLFGTRDFETTVSFQPERPNSMFELHERNGLGFRQPLVIELGVSSEHGYMIECWHEKRVMTPDGTRKQRLGAYHDYSGVFTPNLLKNSPDRVVIEVDRAALSGMYWMPLCKYGKGETNYRVNGLGRSSRVRFEGSYKEDFCLIGPSTTHSLRHSLARNAARKAKDELMRVLESPNMVTAERTARRDVPLSDFENRELARQQILLARSYQNRGEFNSSYQLYRDAIQRFEIAYYSKRPNELVSSLSMGKSELCNELALLYDEVGLLSAADPRDGARNGPRAKEYAQLACELSEWKDSDRMETLAAAYAQLADFPNAINHQEAALKIIGSTPGRNPKQREGAVDRLAMYRRNEPFRLSMETVRRLPPGVRGVPINGDGFPLRSK